jgi:SAM-dependent methyltransferase
MGYEPQSWEARHAVAANVFVPWIDRAFPLPGKTVLEYGSGGGAVGCAVAQVAGRHLGYDIDAGSIGWARENAARLGIENTTVEAVAADQILSAVARHRGEVDVFLLYAVLEHMTIAERLDVLRLAAEVVRPDGVIVVIETPNRLVDFDYHTSLLPFFSQLPIELALAYADRSPRADFRDALAAGEADPDHARALALTRWGLGASFHEFELVFGDLGSHLVADGYDPLLLHERTIHREELALARYLESVRPDLPAAFSRYWIDLILTPSPTSSPRQRTIRPWVFDTTASPGAGVSAEGWIELPSGSALVVELPHTTRRLVSAAFSPAVEFELTVTSASTSSRARAEGDPGGPRIFDVRMDEPANRFELGVNEDARIDFVGYEAPVA